MTSLRDHLLAAFKAKVQEMTCDLPVICSATSKFNPRAELSGLGLRLFRVSNAWVW